MRMRQPRSHCFTSVYSNVARREQMCAALSRNQSSGICEFGARRVTVQQVVRELCSAHSGELWLLRESQKW